VTILDLPPLNGVKPYSCHSQSKALGTLESWVLSVLVMLVKSWFCIQQLMKLMQFLMNLDDCYQPTRSALLTRDPLLDVKDAYTTVSREESHRGVPETFGVSETKMNANSFTAKTFNNNNNTKRSFDNNNNNTRGNVSNNRGLNPNLNYKN
ncbi:hypothetical protein Tco_1468704, partial [Tanacetum coccineum]